MQQQQNELSQNLTRRGLLCITLIDRLAWSIHCGSNCLHWKTCGDNQPVCSRGVGRAPEKAGQIGQTGIKSQHLVCYVENVKNNPKREFHTWPMEERYKWVSKWGRDDRPIFGILDSRFRRQDGRTTVVQSSMSAQSLHTSIRMGWQRRLSR